VEVVGFFLGGSADDADGECRFGLGAVGAGDEVALIVLDGLTGLDGGEEVGEGVGQALLRGGDGGPHGGAEEPDIGRAGGVWGDADFAEGVWAAGVGKGCPAFGVQEGAELG